MEKEQKQFPKKSFFFVAFTKLISNRNKESKI